MADLTLEFTERNEMDLITNQLVEDPGSKRMLTQSALISSFRVAEFVTLARNGSPVCWPLAPELENGRLSFSTGYIYPTKARNAQRNPRVAALFSDPTASGSSEDHTQVLVQGLAEVFDQDLQRNTERYVDQLLQKGPLTFRLMLRTPGLRQLMVGYLARIWIEVIPEHEYAWAQGQVPAGPLQVASRPASFSPGPGIKLSQNVFQWLSRYTRPPVLSYVDRAGWPAMTRVPAKVNPDYIGIESEIETCAGAPACLTYHRLVGNYTANDAFLIRGHFDEIGRLVPEKVVGFGGTQDDRGLGSVKMIRMLLGFRKQLSQQMEKEAHRLPVVRPTQRSIR